MASFQLSSLIFGTAAMAARKSNSESEKEREGGVYSCRLHVSQAADLLWAVVFFYFMPEMKSSHPSSSRPVGSLLVAG